MKDKDELKEIARVIILITQWYNDISLDEKSNKTWKYFDLWHFIHNF